MRENEENEGQGSRNKLELVTKPGCLPGSGAAGPDTPNETPSQAATTVSGLADQIHKMLTAKNVTLPNEGKNWCTNNWLFFLIFWKSFHQAKKIGKMNPMEEILSENPY